MPKIPTLADVIADRERDLRKEQLSSNFNEGTELCVTCSQSYNGRKHSRSTMCKFDIEPTFDSHAGFPLNVSIIVKRASSSIILASSDYILDYRTDKTFWIPYGGISSDIEASDFISKRIFLMNVPFTLDQKLKWKSTSYRDVKITCMLKDKDMLISNIVELAKNMKDCPTLPCNGEWSMSLVITKVTYLPHLEFMEMYKLGLKRDYISETWQRSQGELDARIATLEALIKEVDIKKLRFEVASASEGSGLVDICSICREDFSEGSMVSCFSICSHVYHDTCLLEWLLRNRSCPYCRSELTKKV